MPTNPFDARCRWCLAPSNKPHDPHCRLVEDPDAGKPRIFGTLEGLESGWDSPGLGIHPGYFTTGPTVGQPFRFIPDVGFPATTTHVHSVRLLSKGPGFEVWGFRTLNTTYNLRVHLDA